ncbi:MAG: hypothetical protein WDM85_02190 [Caulobacteraceae bacterium]
MAALAVVFALAVGRDAAAQGSVLDDHLGADGDLHSPIVEAWPGGFTAIAPSSAPLYYAPASVTVVSANPRIVTVKIADMIVRDGQVGVGDVRFDCQTQQAYMEDISWYDAGNKSAVDRQYPAKGYYLLHPKPDSVVRALMDRLCAAP